MDLSLDKRNIDIADIKTIKCKIDIKDIIFIAKGKYGSAFLYKDKYILKVCIKEKHAKHEFGCATHVYNKLKTEIPNEFLTKPIDLFKCETKNFNEKLIKYIPTLTVKDEIIISDYEKKIITNEKYPLYYWCIIYDNYGRYSLYEFLDKVHKTLKKDITPQHKLILYGDLKQIKFQILIQLLFLRSKGISHSDLHGSNIIVKKIYPLPKFIEARLPSLNVFPDITFFYKDKFKAKMYAPRFIAFFIDYGMCTSIQNEVSGHVHFHGDHPMAGNKTKNDMEMIWNHIIRHINAVLKQDEEFRRPETENDFVEILCNRYYRDVVKVDRF